MSGARVSLVVLTAALAGLSGCGAGAQRTPELSHLPLVGGARISVAVKACDKGAVAFCGWELVVMGPRYRSSDALLRAEHRLLLKLGWSGGQGDIAADEHAADSPGHKLRLTYATPNADLKDWDFGFIHRSRPVILALSRSIFYHQRALSMLLEIGSS